MYIKLNASGRVCAAALNGILPDGMKVAIPDGFELDKHGDWRLEGGALVYDPLPELAPPPSPVELLQAEVTDLTLALAELIGTGFEAERGPSGALPEGQSDAQNATETSGSPEGRAATIEGGGV